MKQNFTKLIIALLAITASCKKGTTPTPPDTTPTYTAKAVTTSVSTALTGKDSLTTYAAIFANVNLTDAEASGGVTVFAPVNKAFTALAINAASPLRTFATTQTTTPGTMLPDSSDARDYIVKGKIAVTALINGATFTSLSGKVLTITVTNGNIKVNGVLVSNTSSTTGDGYLVFTISAFLNDSKEVKIISASDASALPGWLITINGQNFSTTVANDVVLINGVPATVHTATATQLTATVPANATSGNVTVTVNGKTILGHTQLSIMQATVSSIAQITALKSGNVQSVALDANDNLFFTDNLGTTPYVRRFDAGGTGTAYSYRPTFSNPNGDGTTIPAFGGSGLWAITLDAQGNVYASSAGSNTANVNYPGIFKFNTATSTTSEYWSSATSVKNTLPGKYVTAMKMDAAGNLFYISTGGLYKMSPAGISSILAPTSAFLSASPVVTKSPSGYGLDIDAVGNIYISDAANFMVWKVSATGTVTAIAGNGVTGFKDDIGNKAQFRSPFGIAVDKRGDVYVTDNDYNTNNFLIRMINPQGVVSTIAGKVNPNYLNTDGVGTQALFNGVNALAIDSKGVLYVGLDGGGVRKITIAAQ